MRNFKTVNEVRFAFMGHEFPGMLIDFSGGGGYRLSWRGEVYFFHTAAQLKQWANIHFDD